MVVSGHLESEHPSQTVKTRKRQELAGLIYASDYVVPKKAINKLHSFTAQDVGVAPHVQAPGCAVHARITAILAPECPSPLESSGTGGVGKITVKGGTEQSGLTDLRPLSAGQFGKEVRVLVSLVACPGRVRAHGILKDIL